MDDLAPRITLVAGGIGVLFLAISAVLGFLHGDGGRQFFFSYLAPYMLFLALTLGGLFMVVMFHLTGTRWGIVVRRVAEIVANNAWVMAILILPILIPMLMGNHHLYMWTDHEVVAQNHALHAKAPYLNVSFFAARMVFYFAVWILLAWYYLRKSSAQDVQADPRLSNGPRKWSGPAMILFGLTMTFAAFDLLMSLEPGWFSTIFGVYYFATCVLMIYCSQVLLLHWLQRRGRLLHSVNIEHYHDLGKMMFAFVFFWGYIGFSQFMLIWYANIPEETVWFQPRMNTSWAWWSLLLLFGHLLIPFPGLLSRHMKRHRLLLQCWAAWLILMCWADMYWLVMPTMSPHGFTFHLLDITCLLGIGGISIAAIAHRAKRYNLVPVNDPYLPQSLAFENPY